MERREFLRWGAAAGLATIGGATSQAHGSQLPPPSSLSDADMDAYLARLDAAMDALSRGSLRDEFLPGALPPTADEQHAEELCKKGLRSLLLVGMFRDLPAEARAHPGMQQRLWDAMPDMDDAVFGTTRVLSHLSSAEHDDLQQTLKAEPDLIMRMGGLLDQHAAAANVPMKRRLHLRKLLTDVSWRLRNQSPALVIQEYVDKVHKVAARYGAEAQLEPDAAARTGDGSSGEPSMRQARTGSVGESGQEKRVAWASSSSAPIWSSPSPATATRPQEAPASAPSSASPEGATPQSGSSTGASSASPERAAPPPGSSTGASSASPESAASPTPPSTGASSTSPESATPQPGSSTAPSSASSPEGATAPQSPDAASTAVSSPTDAAAGETAPAAGQSTAHKRFRDQPTDRKVLTVGAWIFGIGAVTGGASYLLTAVEFGWVYVTTAGVIITILGLIVLLVGAALYLYRRQQRQKQQLPAR